MGNGSTTTLSIGSLMDRLLTYVLLLLSLCPCAVAQRISSTDTLTEHSLRGTFYHDRFVGRKTSSGEVFRQDGFTAAHRYLKFGTLLLVTNPKNGKQVIVKINDRCPKDKILDMTRLAATTLGIKSSMVTVRVLPPRYMPQWEQQSKQKNTSSPVKKKDLRQLYDIMLIQGYTSINTNSVNHIPILFQDKVGTRDLNDGSGRALFLFLALPQKDAAGILESVRPFFPQAMLVESD